MNNKFPVTVVYIDEETGEARVATSVPDHEVMVTKSLREFDYLKRGLEFEEEPSLS